MLAPDAGHDERDNAVLSTHLMVGRNAAREWWHSGSRWPSWTVRLRQAAEPAARMPITRRFIDQDVHLRKDLSYMVSLPALLIGGRPEPK
jgi:hypothetical protein